jgi:maltose alpha-D-glucosyltransferase/alpha-amylase
MNQQRDPSSLLNFIERLITTRKQVPEIGSGTYKFIKGISDSIIIHTCDLNDTCVLFIHNFTNEILTLPAIDIIGDNLVFEVFGDNESFIDEELLILQSYGFIWLRIENKKP